MKTFKAILTVVVIITTCSFLSAQVWFDLGLKGAYGLTMMANKNIFDDRDIDHQLSSGYGYGASIGVHFGDHQGVLFEYMRATSKQKFNEETNPTQHNNYEWKSNDILLLYRFTGYGAYFEVGPKISLMSEVTNTLHEMDPADVTADFEKQTFSGVLGFGSYLAGSDLFSLQIGVRLHYQFGDMVSAQGRDNNVPAYIEYDTYKQTNAIAAQLHLEFNYAFGRFAKASCRDRWKLILFQ